MPDNKTLFERLDQNTKNKINKYVDLAIEFNATHNIFARSNKKEVFNKDILDCLPVLEHIYENKSVMDLGPLRFYFHRCALKQVSSLVCLY